MGCLCIGVHHSKDLGCIFTHRAPVADRHPFSQMLEMVNVSCNMDISDLLLVMLSGGFLLGDLCFGVLHSD